MTIQINATCEVAKTFNVKREKGPDDIEVVVAHLKVADVLLMRDQLDEVAGMPIGWSTTALFDEQGAPYRPLSLGVPRLDLTLTGVIRGSNDDTDGPRLTLNDAAVSGVQLDLVAHGALLSCSLAWKAAGDEVDDIADLLGKLCGFRVSLVDGGQRDLLADSVSAAARNLRRMADADGIDSVEIRCGDAVAKIEGKNKRKGREGATA